MKATTFHATLSALVIFMCSYDSLSAAEYSFSGFGTIGGAISDREANLQRTIDSSGSINRDSLLAVQFDAKLSEQWSITSQLLIAPQTDSDSGYEPQLKWTLISYRPANDWLIRLGRLSLGGLLNQQNMDVGVSYDMARLPNEVYLLSSSYDFDGLSIAKTWNMAEHEVTLDGSFGVQQRDFRAYLDGSGYSTYYSADITGGGLVLTVSDFDQSMYRVGWHVTKVEPDMYPGLLTKYYFTPIGNGYYTLSGFGYDESVTAHTFFLGGRVPIGNFLLSAEGTLFKIDEAESIPTTIAAYLSISRKIDKWTPYVTYAQMWSDTDTWKKVKGATPVPQYEITQEKLDNTASAMAVYQQYSIMLGTSYAVSPKQKIKTELMFTHVGDHSSMIDGDLSHETVTVFSVSYNFAF